MEVNKRKVFFVAIISIVLAVIFIIMNFTVSNTAVRGIKNISYVKETDTEFELEKDASLRNKPNFSSKIIGTIKKDTKVQVLQKLNKWIKITDGVNLGWVVMQNVVTVEIENTVDILENNTVDNQSNTTNNLVENKVSNETVNNVTNKVENKVSNNVNNNTSNMVNSTSNKVSNSTTSSTSTSNVGKKGVVNVETAKVREKPDGKMVGLVDIDDKVEILAEEGDWYKVNVDEYKGCYIAKRLVTIK